MSMGMGMGMGLGIWRRYLIKYSLMMWNRRRKRRRRRRRRIKRMLNVKWGIWEYSKKYRLKKRLIKVQVYG
jgi:hypothetical protein